MTAAAVAAGIGVVAFAWLTLAVARWRRRARAWRAAASSIETATFHCRGDERNKRVQP